MFTKSFKQISKKNIDIVGGKGASLGEMKRVGMRVPNGFVVLAPAFDMFLREAKGFRGKKQQDLNVAISAELDKVNYDDINSVDRASSIIRDLVLDAPMPKNIQKEILSEFKKLKSKYVAVRSSATAEDSSAASWAGELETYLDTTEKKLVENVKKCWSSLFTSRAIFYRQEKGLLKTKVSVAVVVQQMVESEISGIAFTVHPVTKDKNQMIIEAGWGLGEVIVSGQVTPDSYVIDKRDYSLIDINVSDQDMMIVRDVKGGVKKVSPPKTKQEKQKLSENKIIELAKICVNIEKHYKKPQDIEWALTKGKFYITQSRPITTL